MKPQLVPCGDKFIPASLEDVLEIESILGAKLPDDYREFVLKYGRSYFSPLAAVQPIEKPPFELWGSDDKNYLPFAAFFGGEQNGMSLLDNVRTSPFKDFFPRYMLSIADDLSLNQYLLAVDGEHKNKVFFWFYEGFIEPDYYISVDKEIPPDWQYQNLFLAADSFSDLLNQFIVDPELTD